MSKTSSTTKQRRRASDAAPEAVKSPSKLDTLLTLLRRPNGASIDDLATATAWQKHSVRGALAGTLKRKGHIISSEVVDGVRRYRIAEIQA